MRIIQPDFREAVEFGLIEPGIYLCKVLEADTYTAAKTGTQCISWKLETVLASPVWRGDGRVERVRNW